MSSILVVDSAGAYISLAQRLTKEFDTVYLHEEWDENMSSMTSDKRTAGSGIEGLQKVSHITEVLYDVDVVLYPSCTRAVEQMDLLNRSFPIFGSGTSAALENDRELLLNKLKEWELPEPEYLVVTSIDTLLKKLENIKEAYIKISTFRMDLETYHHWSMDATRIRFERLRSKIGTYANQIKFIIEFPIKGIELGTDEYTIRGKMPAKLHLGYELKNQLYLVRAINRTDMPEKMQTISADIAAYTNESGVSCVWSNEVRVDKTKFYLTDPTMRFGIPAGECMYFNMQNMGEMMKKGVHGDLVEPDFKYKYVAQVILTSKTCPQDWLYIKYPKEFSDNIRFYNYTIQDGKTYVIPSADLQDETFCSVLSGGDSYMDALESAYEIAAQVQADGCSYDKNLMLEAKKTIEEGEAQGIHIF